MSTQDQQLVRPARGLQCSFAFACAVVLLMGSPADASSTVLQFAQLNPNDVVTASDNSSGVTTLSTGSALNTDGGNLSIPVLVTNFLGTSFPSGFTAYETMSNVTSVGLAGTDSFSGYIEQKFSGTITFTSGINGTGANYLTAMFSSMTFSPILGGAPGGTGAVLSAAQPPDSLTLTSQFASLGSPTAMSIGFSNVTPALSIAGDGSLASFNAQNAGTFSSADPTPEPGTLFMGSVAVVIGALAYGKKWMKGEPAK